MALDLSPGKWQRLRSLTDGEGRFKMLAIDQRDSLRRAIARATGHDARDVADDDLAKAKAAVTKLLAPYATAVLTDPVYGYPHSLPYFPPRVGLLLAYEESGYTRAGAGGRERQSLLLEHWSVERSQRLGADAVKLLIYYHPDASEGVRRHQQDLVQQVGEECARADMPFLLELVSYALEEESADTHEFARKKPDLVIRSAAEFSKPHYQVDILKLEFPADLKWTREFASGAFDSKERRPAYALSAVQGYCHELDAAASMPWVILSAGVNIGEFLIQVDLATDAGASGFLCGRAIWQDAITHYPQTTKVEQWLCSQGVSNFVRANAHAEGALSWFCHRKFGGPHPQV